MALVHDGTMTMSDDSTPDRPGPDPAPASSSAGQPAAEPVAEAAEKKVFLVAAFRPEGAAPVGPATGMAEDIVAVIGMGGDQQRFEWVGDDQEDSVTNPALVTPVKVPLALPSPWHPPGNGFVTGLVQLAPTQLGGGSVDDDVDHLLTELSKTRHQGTTRHPEVG